MPINSPQSTTMTNTMSPKFEPTSHLRLTLRGLPTPLPTMVLRLNAAIFLFAVPLSSSLTQSASSRPWWTQRRHGRFLSQPFLVAMHRVQRECSSSAANSESMVSCSSEATLGDSNGVARGSVRRMSWIATSSSEMTLAEVGVGVA